MKLKTKILIVTVIALFAVIIGATNVKAAQVTSEDGKVLIKEEITEGLFESINEHESTDYEGIKTISCYLVPNPDKLIDLLLDTKKLDNLVESDNCIYQKIYVKLDENVTDVTWNNYVLNAEEQEAKIVTIDNNRYVEIKVAIAIKLDGKYSNSQLNGDGRGTLCPSAEVFANIYTNDKKEKFLFSMDLESLERKYTYISLTLSSDTNKEYYIGGAGDAGSEGQHFDRVMAEGNCYIYANVAKYVGETINIEPFGTLTYKGTNGDETYTSYTYEARIKDKTIFNNDRIVCVMNNKEHQIIGTSILFFEGDLVKIEDKNISDTDTNVKLESNTNVVPKDTILVVKDYGRSNTGDNFTFEKFSEMYNEIFRNSKNFRAYDIHLEYNGKTIQPNGTVKIKIPIPEEFDVSNLVVYRIEENEKIEYNVTVETIDGKKYAVFETDHFSTYALVEKLASTSQEQEAPTNNKGELDETPKTGTTDVIKYILPITLMSAVGILALRKRK